MEFAIRYLCGVRKLVKDRFYFARIVIDIGIVLHRTLHKKEPIWHQRSFS